MKKVFSVTELTKRIKKNLEDVFTRVWVEGEVSNFTRHTSGHMYFTIKDEHAQLSVVMFRTATQSLTFEITNGLHIVIFGRISVYEKRGNYQLYADVVEPKGIGALQLAYEQLKEKLQKEGLFDKAHKKELPVFPRVIGVVTSPTGAAIRDIIQIVNRRFSNVHIILNPVKVQGEGAREAIARAIDECNEYGVCDVLIVGRGGGSLEDLWAFNEEVVARAIFRSRIPIISAVGHEIDFTISDFVADVRASTPSAAAELVVRLKSDWEEHIRTCTERLHKSMCGFIEEFRMRLESIVERYAFRQPLAYVTQYVQRIDELVRQINNYIKMIVHAKHGSFEQCMGKLHALSPIGILSRGYSISMLKEKRKALTTVRALQCGDVIETKLHTGSFDSTVVNIRKS